MHATHTFTQPMSMRVCMLRLSNQQQQEEEEAREHQLLCSTCIKAHEKQHAKIKQFDFLFLALFICFFFCRHRYPLCPTRLGGTGLQMCRLTCRHIQFLTLLLALLSPLFSSLLCSVFSLVFSYARTELLYNYIWFTILLKLLFVDYVHAPCQLSKCQFW